MAKTGRYDEILLTLSSLRNLALNPNSIDRLPNSSDKDRFAHVYRELPKPITRIRTLFYGIIFLYYRQLKTVWQDMNGYRFAILFYALLAAMVLIINITFTIWAIKTFDIIDGLGILQDGNCEETKRLTFWLHLAINILSTALLGASNYSMQCPSSPTRGEIDKAHSKGVWLDIGVPSFANLSRISSIRKTLWWLLALSSIPLHLLYNSAIFSTLCTNNFNVYIVSDNFLDFSFKATEHLTLLDGCPTSAPDEVKGHRGDNMGAYGDKVTYGDLLGNKTLEALQAYHWNTTSFEVLSNEACIKIYTNTMHTTYSDVLLVSRYSSSISPILFSEGLSSSVLSIEGSMNAWNCSGTSCNADNTLAVSSDWSKVLLDAEDWSVQGCSIQYCLSQRATENCKLQFSLAIMITVIMCNLIKVICLSVIVWTRDQKPLVTLGDAIASFLEKPDPNTAGCCIFGKLRFETNHHWHPLALGWAAESNSWFRAASKRRWFFCNFL